MKKVLASAFALAAAALICGCGEPEPLTPEESAAKVREANEAAMDSPTSGAANPAAAEAPIER
ncbi:MAG: hypothetical protein MH204_10640 [Fimbriimonadaceae bacterium]|nr:hypothetical protein [Fimbriimonadaceae bacterium]